MNVPLLDLKAQYATIKDEAMAAIEKVMDSQYFILGPEVAELEKEVADYSHCEFALGVSSGTDALLISLMAEKIGVGDEVIVPVYSFFATAGCVSRLGAKPVFVDIDPISYNIIPKAIERAITSRTKAIIPVHLYGQMADMKPIQELVEGRNIVIIEDAAQAIGSEYHGKRAGSMRDYGCFSFFPSKNMGGIGDGGMVVTNDADKFERMRVLRVHGGKPKYYHRVIGGNFRLDAIQAAVLRVKLRYLDQWTGARQRNAEFYRNEFKKVGIAIDYKELGDKPGVSLPTELSDRRHIYNQFIIRSAQRDELREFLQSNGIGCEIYYPVPFQRQDCFSYLGYVDGDFPASNAAAEQSLALPIYPELTAEQMKYVVDTVKLFYNK
jgi:dTDP-4-amino-4,6-dideoxygalactose transaminase